MTCACTPFVRPANVISECVFAEDVQLNWQAAEVYEWVEEGDDPGITPGDPAFPTPYEPIAWRASWEEVITETDHIQDDERRTYFSIDLSETTFTGAAYNVTISGYAFVEVSSDEADLATFTCATSYQIRRSSWAGEPGVFAPAYLVAHSGTISQGDPGAVHMQRGGVWGWAVPFSADLGSPAWPLNLYVVNSSTEGHEFADPSACVIRVPGDRETAELHPVSTIYLFGSADSPIIGDTLQTPQLCYDRVTYGGGDGWGTSQIDDRDWTQYGTVVPGTVYTADGRGWIATVSGIAGGYNWLDLGGLGTGPDTPLDVTFSARGTFGEGGTLSLNFELYKRSGSFAGNGRPLRASDSDFVGLLLQWSGGEEFGLGFHGHLEGFDGAGATSDFYSFTDADFGAIFDFDFAPEFYIRVRVESGALRLKMWLIEDSEPGWQVEETAVAYPSLNVDTLKIEGDISASDGTSFDLDFIRFDEGYGAVYEDEFVRAGGATSPDRPVENQPVQDELVGIGDGATTEFTTDYAYVAGTLQAQVAGMLSDVDHTDPAGRLFTLVSPPPVGSEVRATYRASGD